MTIAFLAAGLLLLTSAVCTNSARAEAEVPLATTDAAASNESKKKLTVGQIKQLLIDESIAAYSGNCPCPYNTARNGSRCGRRSAYSREGGQAPLCYPKDVSADMVNAYRAAHADD